MLAPLVICAFNRVDVLKNTVASLVANELALETELYIFVDGPRDNKEGEADKVRNVVDFAKTVTGFKSVMVNASPTNKGLAKSIIGAATELLSKYGRVIVVEDDLYCSESFLRYMNTMLDLFEKDKRVMQISGYSSKLHLPKSYPWDIYMSGRAHSWSWATWMDRWETVDWEVKDFDQLANDAKAIKSFNTFGSDLFGMLKGWKEKRNNSWYIRFNYAMHKKGQFCICPTKSLVRNDGFGAESTHCSTYNRYKIEFDAEHKGMFKTPAIPEALEPNVKLMKHAVRYWSIPYRIYGKIMTILTK